MARVNIHDLDAGIHIEVTAEKPEQVQPWIDWLHNLNNPSTDQPSPPEPIEEEIDEERLDR